MNQQRWNRGAVIFGSLTVTLLLIGLFWPASGSDRDVVTASATTTSTTMGSTTTVPPTPDSECLNSWGRSDSDKAGNRWIAEGIPAIREAKTKEQAQAAAQQWVAVVRKDPVLFKGAIRYILHKDVTVVELFDGNGCATAKAVDMLAEVQTAFALSAFKPEQAPATGYNSGAGSNGTHVADAPGIKGDRTSVRIDLPDQTTVWVMARCGNPVTVAPPAGIPKGPTDNNPPTTTTTLPPGETTSTTQPRTTTTRPGTTTSTTTPRTTTTQPRGKVDTDSPISDNPNDPNEPVRPNTPEPTRPPATSTSSTQPRVPPPTTVAPPAPPPPTTAPAPLPTVGCQDPNGTGFCDP